MKRHRNKVNGHKRRMEMPVAELLMRGRELIRYLRRYGEQHWSDWLEDGLEIVRRDPRNGVAILLAGFEGIGSFADVYLCPEAGHKLNAGDELKVNEQMLVHISQVYRLTRELGDFVDADSFRRDDAVVRHHI